ncbi:MAG: Toluene-4-sulfonate monooxygenase system iron-sulfur subunit TsaM1 [SAR116 cluster bacterium]|nr:MAG: Toluene-4-sulfonate monooxygenase system iron-sulfur subunit TsaM1 [SAR116 cluster bacterium]
MVDIETDFIRDCWYVAGWSADFTNSLSALRILDEPIVIFRTEQGVPAALEDACPHRKLPLSKGRLKGDHVECGYHGLTFDCSGACVKAPTQEGTLPGGVRVRSYPVEDRWGILWIWMGDPAAANPDDIFTIENFDNPAWGRTPCGSMDINCHYLYVVDNLLDPSHVAWVHVSSFAGAGTGNLPLDIEKLDDGVIVSRWVMDAPPPPYYKPILPFAGNCDRKQHYECRLPSIAVNMSIYTRAGTGGDDANLPNDAFINISYNFMTPVDADNTRYFWFQHRNSQPDNDAISQQMFEGAKTAFIEDREVLTEVHRGMKESRTRHINLGIDAGAMRFRKMVERRIAGAPRANR